MNPTGGAVRTGISRHLASSKASTERRADYKRLRLGCEARVRNLDLPDPFDVKVLCDRIGSERARPIHLLPAVLPAQGPCGLLIPTTTADYIIYEQQTSRLHQDHIVLHEVGHLLCQHQAVPGASEKIPRILLPDLDPRLVESALARFYQARDDQ